MLAAVSSLLTPLIWETDKVFALVFVLCVYMLSARIWRPRAISSNEMTFPAFQLQGVISQQCSNSATVVTEVASPTSRGLARLRPQIMHSRLQFAQ